MNHDIDYIKEINSLQPKDILTHIRQTGFSPYFINDSEVRKWLNEMPQIPFNCFLGYGDYISWSNTKDAKDTNE